MGRQRRRLAAAGRGAWRSPTVGRLLCICHAGCTGFWERSCAAQTPALTAHPKTTSAAKQAPQLAIGRPYRLPDPRVEWFPDECNIETGRPSLQNRGRVRSTLSLMQPVLPLKLAAQRPLHHCPDHLTSPQAARTAAPAMLQRRSLVALAALAALAACLLPLGHSQVHTQVEILDDTCDAQLQELWFLYTAPPTAPVAGCDRDCLAACYKTLQWGIYSEKQQDCPTQDAMIACFYVSAAARRAPPPPAVGAGMAHADSISCPSRVMRGPPPDGD